MRLIAAPTDPSDEELMRAVASGRQEAVGVIYARYAPAVFGMASHALGRATAEEMVQDVFLSVWKSAASFQPERGPFRPWLFQIARHRIANELRRRSRRPATVPDPEGLRLASLPDPAPGQDEEAWAEYQRDVLRSAFEKLPASQRQALGLAFFQNLTHEQVASTLDLPLGTAKARIRAGLENLRGKLAPLVAALGTVAILAALLARQGSMGRAFSRDERALAMLTSSDAQALRAIAAPGVSGATHGVYRFRTGSPIAVMTFSNFAPASSGRIYQAWARHGAAWTPLGTALPDAAGKARLIAEAPSLATRPDAVLVTLEPEGGAASPSGPPVVAWPPPGSLSR